MVPFGGWEMPLQYAGIAAEHEAVRTAAGLFDVSHMGELELAGTDALAALQRFTANDPGRLEVGQAQYSALTTPEGTVVDDLLVYRLAPDHFLLVVNAANVDTDLRWMRDALRAGSGSEPADAVVIDTSARYALIALQGPRAEAILQPLTGVELQTIPAFAFATGEVGNARATIARTGYTGEDGFELLVPPAAAEAAWNSVLAAGEGHGLVPAGLGARDTLRLEAGMRLHGQDMDRTTTLLEAGLGWLVNWEKGPFIGRDALAAEREAGPARRLAGFEMIDRGIARHGCDVYAIDAGAADAAIGQVTSGTLTPHLRKAIGMGVRSGGGGEARYRTADRRPGHAPARARGPDAVLSEATMSYPTDLRYTKDHEWIRIEGETGRIGVTDYAQQQLGDVVFVDLPEAGSALTKGEQFGSIESVKAVSDLYAPMSGRVVEVNGALRDQPELVNQDPHGAWMIAIAVDDASEVDDLLDTDGYRSLIGVA